MVKSYNDKISTFKQLLEKDSSASIHTRNLWSLAVEMFKVVEGLATKIFSDLFPVKEQNNIIIAYGKSLFLRYLEIRQCVMV